MIIANHQEDPNRNGEQEGGDYGNSGQAVFLLDSYDAPVSLSEFFLHLLFILQDRPVRSSKYTFPPGDESFGEKCEKVDSDYAPHIGPEDAFEKTEVKLDYNQGKCGSELKGAEQYGK